METPLIYQKIIEVMADINAISKGRKNQQQGFNFRGIDDVMNELHGSLAKCGVFVVPTVIKEERTTGKSRSGAEMFYTRLTIDFTFYAADGSHINAVVIGEAMDSGDKASNKALSIGLKYAMLQVFCIPTEDEKDPDAVTPEPAAGTFKKPAAKFNFEPKGGETTPEEKKEIAALLASKFPDGTPAFNKAEAKKYSEMRKDYTAREVIEEIKKDVAVRCSPTSGMKTAGDILREQEKLPPEVEAVKTAVNGEVVKNEDAIF